MEGHLRAPSGFYHDARMGTGHHSSRHINALQAFWFGMQTLVGDLAAAEQGAMAYYSVWRRYGAFPEVYDTTKKAPPNSNMAKYHLRPELIESVYYLSHASATPHVWLRVAEDILGALEERTQVACGYAGLSDVQRPGAYTDRMESFFLAETLKYLYLTFDRDHFVNTGPYVFNTEAHVLRLDTALELPTLRPLASRPEPTLATECPVTPPPIGSSLIFFAADEGALLAFDAKDERPRANTARTGVSVSVRAIDRETGHEVLYDLAQAQIVVGRDPASPGDAVVLKVRHKREKLG